MFSPSLRCTAARRRSACARRLASFGGVAGERAREARDVGITGHAPGAPIQEIRDVGLRYSSRRRLLVSPQLVEALAPPRVLARGRRRRLRYLLFFERGANFIKFLEQRRVDVTR